MFYSAERNIFYPSSLKGEFESKGAWPCDAIQVSDDEVTKYMNGHPPAGMQRGAGNNGRPAWVPIPPPELDALADRKRREIDQARDATFAAGLEYTIIGEPDVIQTRPQDQINLLGLSAKAQRLIAAGHTDAVFTFRGLSNINHELTAVEMDKLALAALDHIESIYQRSWERKDSIDSILGESALDEADKRTQLENIAW